MVGIIKKIPDNNQLGYWETIFLTILYKHNNSFGSNFRRKAKLGCEPRRNKILQQPHQWAPGQRSWFNLVKFQHIYVINSSCFYNSVLFIYFSITKCRSKALCDNLPLGSPPNLRGWVWWFLKSSHCVSD